jgi:exportin-1
VPSAREPEVLSAMGTIVNKLGGHITSEVPKIFDAVFECTLEMINKDFEEYPEHRTNFFLLLQVMNAYSNIYEFSLPGPHFDLAFNLKCSHMCLLDG